MAEISEGAAAAALLIDAGELKISSEEELMTALEKVHNIIKSPTKINMSAGERTDYMEWFDPDKIKDTYKKANTDAKLTAIVHGYSTALAFNKWVTTTHDEKTSDVKPGNVFLTGGSWDNKIKFLQVTAQNWKDYNSSDLVVIKGSCYYGISLKKKNTVSAANPPMINKSVIALLEDLGKGKVADELYKTRIGFYGGLVQSASKSGNPLAGSNIPNNNQKAFLTQIRHPKDSKGWINLIDLKGGAKLKLLSVEKQYISDVKDGVIICSSSKPTATKNKDLLKNEEVIKLFALDAKKWPETKWAMRKFVNGNLSKAKKGFFQETLKIVNSKGVPEKIGGYLLSAVLKTELKEKTDEVLTKGKHFGFALVTAIGKVNKGKLNGTLTEANIKDNPLIQQTLADLNNAIKNKKVKIELDTVEIEKVEKAEKETGKGPPAKMFFVVNIGGIPILKFQLRYKGSFSPSPQFLGGMSNEFEKLLKSTEVKEKYKFGKACK